MSTEPQIGTRRNVIVKAVSRSRGLGNVVVTAIGANNEGYILTGDVGLEGAKTGDFGTVTLTHGGATGAFWKYRKIS